MKKSEKSRFLLLPHLPKDVRQSEKPKTTVPNELNFLLCLDLAQKIFALTEEEKEEWRDSLIEEARKVDFPEERMYELYVNVLLRRMLNHLHCIPVIIYLKEDGESENG